MNTSLKKQLKRYSALSSATIAMVNSVNSQVVVTDVLYQGTPNSIYDIDLDNNGVVDFKLEHFFGGPYSTSSGSVFYKRFLKIDGENNNEIITLGNYADKFFSFGSVNSAGYFKTSAVIVYSGSAFTAPLGKWWRGDCGTQDKYIGTRFDIDGDNHYGWIRLSTKRSGALDIDITYYISSWAYEAQPDTPIVTPAVTNKSATNVMATDISNNGDASDIQINFDRAVDEYDFQNQGTYKIFLSKNATPPDVAINSNFYEITMNGSANYSVVLPSNFTDVDGNLIEPDVQYYVYVFAVYSCEEYLSDVETISINGVVGVKDTSSTPRMTVYPNPTSGELTVISDYVIELIEITDVTGKTVYNSEFLTLNSELDISQLSEGLYYMKVTYQNQKTAYQKIVKR
jgi:hypothetical protein